MSQSSPKPRNSSREHKQGKKRAYQKPRLSTYGSMGKLTMGGGTMPNPDGNSGMAML